jgi:hypothetical protein
MVSSHPEKTEISYIVRKAHSTTFSLHLASAPPRPIIYISNDNKRIVRVDTQFSKTSSEPLLRDNCKRDFVCDYTSSVSKWIIFRQEAPLSHSEQHHSFKNQGLSFSCNRHLLENSHLRSNQTLRGLFYLRKALT